VSGSDGRPAGDQGGGTQGSEDQRNGGQTSAGAIPPSFGASSPTPPAPTPPDPSSRPASHPAPTPPAPSDPTQVQAAPAPTTQAPTTQATPIPSQPIPGDPVQAPAAPEPIAPAATTAPTPPTAVAFPPTFKAYLSPPPPEPEPAPRPMPEPGPMPESTSRPTPEPRPLSEPMPEPDDGSTVGWYPTNPPGVPTAGPFAASARRGAGSLSRSKSARAPGSAWRNSRSPLVNVLLFGLGPLALAGIIVAAFVLVSPGKGSAAANAGFQAGPGATTTQQATESASAAPSPTVTKSAKKPKKAKKPKSAKLPAVSTAKPKPKPKAKTKPKPARNSSKVVPHNLGVPNFDGYCQHIGDRTAEVTADNAYGWHCTLNPAQVIQVGSACAWTYHLNLSQVIDVSTNYFSASAWQCWRINQDLGVLNFTTYCVDAGLGSSKLVAQDAYGWECTATSAAIDTSAACDAVYHVNDAVSRFAVFASPYSWQCWN
jgi:hypothetical protein